MIVMEDRSMDLVMALVQDLPTRRQLHHPMDSSLIAEVQGDSSKQRTQNLFPLPQDISDFQLW